ncbi:phosphoribosylamine--glycine ligase, partial [Candidatus Curtissbacteria bacterium]|nr:phosphoribosylamine--glycine ligase [Candidatus Curtissbacteria bacterium]
MHTATVLVIDGGGRGAVLVKKYLVSRYVSKVYCLPGNDLMLLDKNVRIYPDIKTTDIANIRKIVKGEKIDLVDVAQDDAVAKGLVDALIDDKVKVIGPTRLAGQIEWDKAWARNFMRDFKIPSPEFKVSKSQREAISFIKAQKENEWFVKASGLAAGKGALYAQNNQEAIECIGQMSSFGKAGETFLIEECLAGEEFSSFAIVDGENFIIIGHAQDHKPVYNGNLGPNTGGMGCTSPPMVITADIERQIEAIIKKTTEGLVRMKRPYRGILYLGGMIDQKRKVYVIEF